MAPLELELLLLRADAELGAARLDEEDALIGGVPLELVPIGPMLRATGGAGCDGRAALDDDDAWVVDAAAEAEAAPDDGCAG